MSLERIIEIFFNVSINFFQILGIPDKKIPGIGNFKIGKISGIKTLIPPDTHLYTLTSKANLTFLRLHFSSES